MSFKNLVKKQNTKFNKLPEDLKTLCSFYEWLRYDFLNNHKSSDYFDYSGFRYWLIKELDTWYDMSVEDIPRIKSQSMHFKNWFMLDRKVNKQSLLNVKYQYDYNIKKRVEGLALELGS